MVGSSPKERTVSPESGEQIIEPDNDLQHAEDIDSSLGKDVESSTASITSSILHYRTIHGRTYHSERGNAAYWGSNDEQQSEVMDIGHHMWTLAQDGKLHLAPLKPDIQKALDIGCGTGIFAICEVIGTDISPIQPAWLPPNLKFEIEDCTQEWTFDPNTFDYIYIRYLIGCIPDWGKLFKQAFAVLKPGGYLESFEPSAFIKSDDDTVKPDSPLGRWGGIFVEASKKIGNTFIILEDDLQEKAMKEAGFVDIKTWDFKCPLSPWPKDPKLKEIGQFGELFGTQDIEGFFLLVANTLGWSSEEVLVYIAHIRKQIRDRSHHPYFRLRVVWGRKPAEE
ncbi:hypothetical protein FDECE_8428 [Fusarium decemcellulare]|nr:hypothetical protein FDECE_8428 [Fusarium decemcellulare]